MPFVQVALGTPTPVCQLQKNVPETAPREENDEEEMEEEIDMIYHGIESTSGDEIVATALQYLGCRYRSGGTSPSGFDCSGFTRFIYSLNDMNLPHSSSAQIGEGLRVGRFDLQPGDLVFFSGRGAGGSIGHVGIVMEAYDDGNFRFIHASNSKGVTIDDFASSSYYTARYRGACRVLN